MVKNLSGEFLNGLEKLAGEAKLGAALEFASKPEVARIGIEVAGGGSLGAAESAYNTVRALTAASSVDMSGFKSLSDINGASNLSSGLNNALNKSNGFELE